MAHRLVKPPHIHLGLQFHLVSSQRKEGKRKVPFSQKVLLFWLSTKKKCEQENSSAKKKKITIRLRDTILPRKEAESTKDAPEPASNWCLEYLCDCAHPWLSHFLFVGFYCHSETVFSCVASSCRQLLRMMGNGWASVLKTQSSSGRRSSSENSKYRYLRKHKIIHSVQNVLFGHIKCAVITTDFVLSTCEPPKLCINESEVFWSSSRDKQQYKKKPFPLKNKHLKWAQTLKKKSRFLSLHSSKSVLL